MIRTYNVFTKRIEARKSQQGQKVIFFIGLMSFENYNSSEYRQQISFEIIIIILHPSSDAHVTSPCQCSHLKSSQDVLNSVLRNLRSNGRQIIWSNFDSSKISEGYIFLLLAIVDIKLRTRVSMKCLFRFHMTSSLSKIQN